MNEKDLFDNNIITRLKGDYMSEKELLYLEDALGHEKFLIDKCYEYAGKFTSPELKSLAKVWEQKHQAMFDKLYQLVQ